MLLEASNTVFIVRVPKFLFAWYARTARIRQCFKWIPPDFWHLSPARCAGLWLSFSTGSGPQAVSLESLRCCCLSRV